MDKKNWQDVFEKAKPELDIIFKQLDNQVVYPIRENWFRAFLQTPLDQVKVVIVGQDPYFQTITISGEKVPRATGLSFSVNKRDEVPCSLKNIYKELSKTVKDFKIPKHGDLTSWASQGVLLLNKCLTVKPGVALSCGNLWDGFLKIIIQELGEFNPNIIYLLWGLKAQEIINIPGFKGIVLKAAHPSGFSADRGFFGCNHFNLVNQHLKKLKLEPIDWNVDRENELVVQEFEKIPGLYCIEIIKEEEIKDDLITIRDYLKLDQDENIIYTHHPIIIKFSNKHKLYVNQKSLCIIPKVEFKIKPCDFGTGQKIDSFITII